MPIGRSLSAVLMTLVAFVCAGIANELVIEKQSLASGYVTGGDTVIILANNIKKGVL